LRYQIFSDMGVCHPGGQWAGQARVLLVFCHD
jgi:hypothetical protein